MTLATAGDKRASDETPANDIPALNFEPQTVFDEVIDHVQSHFYRPQALNEDWQANVRRLRQRAAKAASRQEFATVLNELLATLNASHTHYFSIHNPKRYQLLGVFSALFDQDRSDLFVYQGIGIDTRTVDDQTVITGVFDGFAAAKAGLQYGDRIISIDGRPYRGVPSFAESSGPVTMEIARGSLRLQVSVKPEQMDGRTMFETALSSSVRVVQTQDTSIGYLHVWSYAGQKFQDIIRSELLWGQLSQCDAVIVDLRDGWGGADLNYLNLFRPPIATVRGTSREGKSNSYTGVWERPVTLLTNSGSTSGKELFTFGFQKLNLGTVVGETTAGAVLAGRIFLLSNDDVLYLAVSSVKVDDRVLEGAGVKPDVPIARPLDAAGDPQLEKAVELLSNPTR
ncbi:MAG: S41 family peptidase [Planctomycetaceae bacterium]|nr:S41 family peptidase [Planctomycetaceae bacterium]